MYAEQIVTTFSDERTETHVKPLKVRQETRQELELLNLYPQVKYQTFQFFGGAITDAVAEVLENMPETAAREILNAYFGPKGIGYRFIRTHIDSCDFATEQYAAVEDGQDKSFEHFSLKRVENRTIRWIKEVYKVAGRPLPVMLSPWSPPAFMKTNASRVGGGHLKKECYASWARYICRYIQEFRQRGIRVVALSVQNEPNATQTWDSCLFTPEEERVFLKDYLCPTLRVSDLSDIQIYVWDHNKERLFDRACAVLTEDTSPMVSGIAFHWYSGDHFDAIRLVKEHYPDKNLMFSEGCIEYSRFDKNQLANAQRYGHDMLGNLAAGMNQFVDWNICLNAQGGPNYAGNFCEAPIICNIETGEISYKLSFYYIDHFSRYIHPGACRIATTVYTSDLEQVAFQNEDGSIVVVILNRMLQAKEVSLRISGSLIDAQVPPESISTILLRN